MLQTLDIRDFALIEHISVQFSPGLNVLTGETGAGKSIIIDAINTVLGGKAGPALIRQGCEKASIEATFSATPDIVVWLKTNQLIDEEVSELVIAREISKTGSRLRVNGTLVNATVAQELRQALLTLHAQHEARTLLLPQSQLQMLDALGDSKHTKLLEKIETSYRQWKDLNEQLEEATISEDERSNRLNFARFQLQEIEEASLTTADEDQKLEEQCLILANVADLDSAVSSAYDSIKGGEHNEAVAVPDILQATLQKVKDAETLDAKLSAICEPLESSVALLEEAARDLRRYKDGLDTDPESLQSIENRLSVLTQIKRKYGPTLEAALEKQQHLSEEIEKLANSEALLDDLRAEIEKLNGDLAKLAAELSTKRKAIGRSFADEIEGDLKQLGMERCQFQVSFTEANIGPRGIDKVEFLIAPNPGQPLLAVSKIASGGELSRVMLAVKARLAKADAVPTVIFDEIDTGLSGRVLQSMRDKLAALATSHQILCITHQPTIASVADNHVLVTKNQTNDSTKVHVQILNEVERIKSLAGMASGQEDEKTAVAFAQSLIDKAAEIKGR